MDFLILLIGFVLLVKGADLFVDGSSSIAKILKIPPLIIGLTIVAFGTSAPEAAVSIIAGLNGSNEISLGNVIGSNIVNLLVVVGISAVICPFAVKKTVLTKEFPFAILSSFVLLFVAFDNIFGDNVTNIISRTDGLIIIAFLGIFMYYLIVSALKSRRNNEFNQKSNMSVGKSSIYTIIGIIGIILGGQMVVNSASSIAKTFGISETVIGLTIVAIGTSLPELVTSIVAAKKGESDIALGNVIGSNIFNIFFVLALSVIINPIKVTTNSILDIGVLMFASFLTYIFAVRKKDVNRIEGSILVLSYIAYMGYVIIR